MLLKQSFPSFSFRNFVILLGAPALIAACGASSSPGSAGETPPVMEPDAGVAIEILNPPSGTIVTAGSIQVSGTAEQAGSITVQVDSQETMAVDAGDEWQFDLETASLALGIHTVTVTASGQNTSASDSIEIEVNGPGVSLKDHVGSLYAPFDWAGARRDPLDRALEIQDGTSYSPLSQSNLAELRDLLDTAEVIAQIGGMGSAKLNQDDPGTVHPAFKAYMDDIIANVGSAWRDAVGQRAAKVADTVDQDYRFFWQIGNEISALSYSSNVHLYFMDGTAPSAFDEAIIPVYVEYFFAPTVQEMEMVSQASTHPVRIALGSITNASNPAARDFLDALLNHEIEGTFAPELSGRKVYEFVDLLTVHYMMSGGQPLENDYWRRILDGIRDDWFGVGRIQGLWNTEEIGRRAATDGRGAAAAMTIAARYLGWIGEHQHLPHQSKWFYYGANDGPAGQRAADSMANLSDFIGGHAVSHAMAAFSDDTAIEVQFYRIPDTGAAFAVMTNLSETAITLGDVPVQFPQSTPAAQMIQATHYGANATSDVPVFSRLENGALRIVFNQPVTMDSRDAIIILFPG